MAKNRFCLRTDRERRTFAVPARRALSAAWPTSATQLKLLATSQVQSKSLLLILLLLLLLLLL
eukprot:5744528-Pyramimonas_sp.AAC.1